MVISDPTLHAHMTTNNNIYWLVLIKEMKDHLFDIQGLPNSTAIEECIKTVVSFLHVSTCCRC